ncbi:hypothetical protein Syun_014422 [Stephania yunnanensis]|uniref:Uncharacterized protein n=1 Tax=Stephania yunnanensis TaxID=152371 RepID=A0AAP0JLM6_9MAGN
MRTTPATPHRHPSFRSDSRQKRLLATTTPKTHSELSIMLKCCKKHTKKKQGEMGKMGDSGE